MRITIAPWGETLDELVEVARRAERAGAEVVWLPELHRSATIPAAAVAAHTSRVGVGTAVALAFVRSPLVTALEALDLAELSGGRFVLGLGTGVQRLNEDWHHARWGKPVAHLRETVAAVRALMTGVFDDAPIELEGAYEPLRVRGFRRPYPPPPTPVPVYLAAMGPVMLRAVGEIGDGWITHELCSPTLLRDRLLPRLAKGRADAGRDDDAVDVVASVLVSVDDDAASAHRAAASHVGFYATVRTYADLFDFHGLGGEHRAVVERFRGGAVPASGLGSLVPDAMVTAVTASGTTDDVVQRVMAYADYADTLKLSPPTHGLTPDEIRRSQDRLLDLVPTLVRETR